MTTTTVTYNSPLTNKAPEDIRIPPLGRWRGGATAAGGDVDNNDDGSGDRIIWGEFHKYLRVAFPLLSSETASEFKSYVR